MENFLGFPSGYSELTHGQHRVQQGRLARTVRPEDQLLALGTVFEIDKTQEIVNIDASEHFNQVYNSDLTAHASLYPTSTKSRGFSAGAG